MVNENFATRRTWGNCRFLRLLIIIVVVDTYVYKVAEFPHVYDTDNVVRHYSDTLWRKGIVSIVFGRLGIVYWILREKRRNDDVIVSNRSLHGRRRKNPLPSVVRTSQKHAYDFNCL